MATSDPLTAQVIRVTRPDTVHLRVACPQLQSQVSMYMRIHGCDCDDAARQAVCDWVEVHADHCRLRLDTAEWLRDEYGRVLGDLCDLQSGESLSAYLVENGVATPRPNHWVETLTTLMHSQEPEEC
jgi:hypothetical protein